MENLHEALKGEDPSLDVLEAAEEAVRQMAEEAEATYSNALTKRDAGAFERLLGGVSLQDDDDVRAADLRRRDVAKAAEAIHARIAAKRAQVQAEEDNQRWEQVRQLSELRVSLASKIDAHCAKIGELAEELFKAGRDAHAIAPSRVKSLVSTGHVFGPDEIKSHVLVALSERLTGPFPELIAWRPISMALRTGVLAGIASTGNQVLLEPDQFDFASDGTD